MSQRLFDKYRARVTNGEFKLDAAQDAAARRLEALALALKGYRPGRRSLFGTPKVPRGIYLWGDVGRGKSMLMDIFFAAAPVAPKRRVHFNAFMVETHARIHEWRQLDARERARRPEFVRDAGDDPLPPAARAIAAEAVLLCFDEFQVGDVADAMILGRLFEQLLELGVVVVATSNTPPARLYAGGLNRQLFLPFIAMIETRLDIVELSGPVDYRLGRMAGLNLYITPLGPDADAAMDAAWLKLTDRTRGEPETLTVLGRALSVPACGGGLSGRRAALPYGFYRSYSRLWFRAAQRSAALRGPDRYALRREREARLLGRGAAERALYRERRRFQCRCRSVPPHGIAPHGDAEPRLSQAYAWQARWRRAWCGRKVSAWAIS
jgi:cell division protein ZapE